MSRFAIGIPQARCIRSRDTGIISSYPEKLEDLERDARLPPCQ